MSEALLKAAEEKLRQVDFMVNEGVLEWTDEDDALLTSWREAGGSSKGAWEWWAKPAGDADEFVLVGDTRESVIEQAKSEGGDFWPLLIVEACNWNDDIQAEDAPFAEVRNREVLETPPA